MLLRALTTAGVPVNLRVESHASPKLLVGIDQGTFQAIVDQGVPTPSGAGLRVHVAESQTLAVKIGNAPTKGNASAVAAPGAGTSLSLVTPGVTADFDVIAVVGVSGPGLAADAANMRLLLTGGIQYTLACGIGSNVTMGPWFFHLAAGDNLEIRTIVAATAGTVYSAGIYATQLT